MKINFFIVTIMSALIFDGCSPNSSNDHDKITSVNLVLERVRAHEFNPLNDDNSMTRDRHLGEDGIADLEDEDWRIRLLAVRDLVILGTKNTGGIAEGLNDPLFHIRYVCAMALGILKAEDAIDNLEEVVRNDTIEVVRSQAVIALGQMESNQSLGLLREKLTEDPSRDVRHQCELAIYQIENQLGATNNQLSAYLTMDESTFETVEKGSVAPNFLLEDTEGTEWELSDFQEKQWVVLIWVFADWCPVCHGEFHDLIEIQEEFSKSDVQVFTLETHDLYRGRVMVGKELEPEYWFSKESYKEAYTKRIFWPHLLDRAGAVAAQYGADPLAFAVHAEYINRPTTVIIDKEGVVRFSYKGTFWGDRPTIDQTLEMIETGDFSFEHPQRRKVKEGSVASVKFVLN